MSTISCPFCGYSREIPASVSLQRGVSATCPKCKHVFAFDPAPPVINGNEPVAHPVRPPSAPRNGTQKVSLKQGINNAANKRLFVLFLALILVTVGIRLWADSSYRAVPYPNLLAASSEGLAVSAGHTVLVYGADGSLLQSLPVPPQAQPTQIFWDRGFLYLGDMRQKKMIPLSRPDAQAPTFTGAPPSAHFKVEREPATGRLFVSDGGSHSILIFDETGKFLRRFGTEGTGSGQLKFPNELHFDESGRLLVANTKRPSIDTYTPEGAFQGTLVTPTQGALRYPTDFAITPDRLLVLENDGFLMKARARVYDRQGALISDVPTGVADMLGDLAVQGDRLFLTDCTGRQLLAFSLPDLRPLPTFSRDFAAKCATWNKEAEFYRMLSSGSLVALLTLCAPVIFFYVRMKRAESNEVAMVDVTMISATSPPGASGGDLVLSLPVKVGQQKMSVVLLVGGWLAIMLTSLLLKLGVSPPASMLLALAGALCVLAGVMLLIRSGAMGIFRRKKAEAAFKRLVRDRMLDLLPGEKVEKVALVQRGQSAENLSLLVFTLERLLICEMSWNKIARMRQVPYHAITGVSVTAPRSLSVLRQLKVSLTIDGKVQELELFHQKAEYLTLLAGEFTGCMGRNSGHVCAELCLTCKRPLQGQYCATCATKLAPDPLAMWLSLLFPGLGQLRNGELQKGLTFMVLTALTLLLAFVGIRGWFFEAADLTTAQKMKLSLLIMMAPIWYLGNVMDAYKGSIKGRKPL